METSRGFMGTLEYYFVTKAPFHLPAGLKEFIVKFGPWLLLIVLILAIPMVLVLLGVNTAFPAYLHGYAAGAYGWSLGTILSLLTMVLQAVALPGLFKRKMKGWEMLFYATLVSFVSNLVMGNVIGGIIGVIIGLYILFQVKSYYR